MNTKLYALIVIGCLALLVASALWHVSQSGVSTGPKVSAKAQDEAPTMFADGADVPAKIATAPGLVGKPSASTLVMPPTKTPQTPAMNVSPSAPLTSTLALSSTSAASGSAAERTIPLSVARFTDVSIPVEKRSAEVEKLGKIGDADAVRTLMKLGDTYTYLNYKAVEALGNVKTAEVGKYLEGKTGDKDPRIVSYALQSLAKVEGVEAVMVIAATIAANRQRPDGYQDTVCAAGVKALGEIGSPKAIPTLAEEFEKTVGKTLQQEYGSQVVAAIKAIGDPSGVPVLEAYAQRLQVQKDGMADNPMGQRYLEGKIKEVTDAIEFTNQKGKAK